MLTLPTSFRWIPEKATNHVRWLIFFKIELGAAFGVNGLGRYGFAFGGNKSLVVAVLEVVLVAGKENDYI